MVTDSPSFLVRAEGQGGPQHASRAVEVHIGSHDLVTSLTQVVDDALCATGPGVPSLGVSLRQHEDSRHSAAIAVAITGAFVMKYSLQESCWGPCEIQPRGGRAYRTPSCIGTTQPSGPISDDDPMFRNSAFAGVL